MFKIMVLNKLKYFKLFWGSISYFCQNKTYMRKMITTSTKAEVDK